MVGKQTVVAVTCTGGSQHLAHPRLLPEHVCCARLQWASPEPARWCIRVRAGFSTHEKQWVAQMCRSLGADYLPDLRANRSTHLVCRSMITAVNTPKYSSALRWGIKVSRLSWTFQAAGCRRRKAAAPGSRTPCCLVAHSAPGQ